MNKALWMATTVMAMIALAACAGPTATPVPTPTTRPEAAPTPAVVATPTPSLVATPRPTPTATPRPAPTPTPLGRQEALVAAAKKEGAVVFWGTTLETAPKYLTKFKERYPFLEIKMWDATGGEIAEKVLTEAKVNRHSVDVLQMDERYMIQLRRAAVLEKYEWPSMAAWPSETQYGEGFYSNFMVVYNAPVYNSKLVSPAEAPKSWGDLKNPKWKGKAAASMSSAYVPLIMAAMWGREGKMDWDRSFGFWQEVFQNIKPRTVMGYSGPTRLLGAGEFLLFLDDSGAVATREKLDAGLPIELVPVDLVPGLASTVATVKDAPHPNAAKLLADYLTSTEGQIMYADHIYMSPVDPKAAAQAKPGRLIKEKGIEVYILPSALLTQENLEKADAFWREMLGVK